MTLLFNCHPCWRLGNNQSIGSSVPVVSRWLWPGNRTFLEVASKVVTWLIVVFYAVIFLQVTNTDQPACNPVEECLCWPRWTHEWTSHLQYNVPPPDIHARYLIISHSIGVHPWSCKNWIGCCRTTRMIKVYWVNVWCLEQDFWPFSVILWIFTCTQTKVLRTKWSW